MTQLSRFFTTVFLIAACGTGCASSVLTFQSTPADADVYAARLGANAPELIGKTPVTIKAAEFEKKIGGPGPFNLEFKKDGHNSARTLVTEASSVDLTISMELTPVSGLEDQEKLNAVIDQVFEAQRLARAGRYDDALLKLSALEKDVPQLAAIHELQGGIYYIQKKFKESLDAYSIAAHHNPKNSEAVRMRNALEISLKVERRRIPAAIDSKAEQPVSAKEPVPAPSAEASLEARKDQPKDSAKEPQ
ncbi:MAG: hypothetical protein H7222_12875 [Methylotenera sp.]|nr:hypothetical protein [Oligoflexia bacterium]